MEDLPLALDGVDDHEHGKKVQRIRLMITSQWARTMDFASQHGVENVMSKERQCELESILQKLLLEYSQVLSFAPEPDLKRFVQPEPEPRTCDWGVKSPASSSTGPTSPSVSDQIPFDVNFFQAAGDDVWTVLQVWVDNICISQCFLD